MEIVEKAKLIVEYYKKGLLGGEKMPEDSNPALDKFSNENCLYFTLSMALNYQRNSYKLWESACATYFDLECKDVFNPCKVVDMEEETLRAKLVKHKLALQPNKQPLIWKRLCKTFVEDFNGSVVELFQRNEFDIKKIKEYILSNKPKFPYLSGAKILNYWLYVLTNYTGFPFSGRDEITIAPDTHILQASEKLGVISKEELSKGNIREITSARWAKILEGEALAPIDLHTPFWLWSRGGFKIDV